MINIKKIKKTFQTIVFLFVIIFIGYVFLENIDLSNSENSKVASEVNVNNDTYGNTSKYEPSLGSNSKSKLRISYIDVGQGNSTLIQSQGINVIVDTGDTDYEEKLINYLNDNGVKKIDILILTHPHADHIGNATKLINTYQVNKIYMPDYSTTTDTYKTLLKTIKKKGLKITKAVAGQKFSIGNAHAQIISPGKSYDDINATSIVLKITYQSNKFLIAGDATKETENDILANGYDVKSDVYLVAHHGSDTSNSLKYLKKVNPTYAVISVGKDNMYGHPTKIVLSYLSEINAKILRTDLSGDIIFNSDGNNLTYSVSKKQTNNNTNSTNSQVNYIGNVNSKVFHIETCDSLPYKNNRVYFDSIDDAEAAGYHACQKCLGNQ